MAPSVVATESASIAPHVNFASRRHFPRPPNRSSATPNSVDTSEWGSGLNIFPRRNPAIRTFDQGFCPVGKAKKLALTACMRNLLTVFNAMLKSGAPWRVTASQST